MLRLLRACMLPTAVNQMDEHIGSPISQDVREPANFSMNASEQSSKQGIDSHLKIVLLKPSGEDPMEVKVDAELSVAALKRKVQESDPSYRNAAISFVWGERVLDDVEFKSLHDHGITNGTELMVVKQKCPAILTASRDKTAKLWNSANGECTRTFTGHSSSVVSAGFSVDEASVLTACGASKIVSIWGGTTENIGKCIQTLKTEHAGAVRSAVFSADEASVLTASNDKSAKIWSSSTGLCTQTFEHEDRVLSAIFSVDESLVLTSSKDNTAKIWSSTTGRCTQTFDHPNMVLSAVFSADESSVLTACGDRAVRIWSSATGACTQTIRSETLVLSAVFSADKSSVLTACEDDTAKIWSTATGICTQTFIGHTHRVLSAVFSADESAVLTASDDNTAKIWSSATGQCIRTFTGHTGGVVSAVFSSW